MPYNTSDKITHLMVTNLAINFVFLIFVTTKSFTCLEFGSITIPSVVTDDTVVELV